MLPWELRRRTGFTSSTARETTLKFWKESSLGSGTYTEVNIDSSAYCNFKWTGDTSHPATVEFEVKVSQHTLPLARFLHVIFTHEDYGGMDTPLFEGFVTEIKPVSTLTVRVTCYDPTARAAAETPVMSGVWQDGTPPTPGTSTIPRLVFNCKIPTDEDTAFHREADADATTILTYLHADPLYYWRSIYAAPLTTNPYQTTAYVAAELAGLDFKPQDKIVFENIGTSAAIQSMMDVYPAKRMFFEPGRVRRYWHWYDMLTAPTKTLTLNDSSDLTVLSLDINSTIDGRFSALTIYGPQTRAISTVSVNGGTLTELWNSTEETQTLGKTDAPPHNDDVLYGDAFQAWQVTDSTKRRMSEILPEDYDIEVSAFLGGSLAWLRTRKATLQVQWTSGADWQPVEDRYFELDNGIVRLRHRLLKTTQNGSTYTYTGPYDVRLTYAYYTTPLSVRYPTSGFSGTLYSVAGLSIEKRIYDEALAVGYENGTPVGSAERTAQYLKLAENYQKAYRDIAWFGQCVIQGIQWQFARLNKRLNFTAIDGDGGAVTTGWEAINAPLTGCEFDFTNKTTTLTFNGDLAEFQQTDLDGLKGRLKVDSTMFNNITAKGVKVRVNGIEFGYTATHQKAELAGEIYENAAQTGDWSKVNDLQNNLVYNKDTMQYEDRRMKDGA